MSIEHLVIDSSALFHNGPIRETAKNVYTCQEALDEIKDKATLERLRILPFELKVLQVHKDDLDIVVDFAKRTGDFKQLSATDLKLIALTYRLEKQHNGLKHVNNEPKQVTVKSIQPKPASDIMSLTAKHLMDSDDEEEADEEDGGGWITPQNIQTIYKKLGCERPVSHTTELAEGDRVTVACMTSDFSIQNCSIQMGLLIVSPVDGLLIKEAKKIALRCHACFKVFYDLTKVKNNTCSQCGNVDTLKRVQYLIEKDGTKRVLINFKRPIKVKGTNKQSFSMLATPRGGKHVDKLRL